MIFFSQGFLSRTMTIRRTAGEERESSLFLSTTSTRSRTFRHLLAVLHVRCASPLLTVLIWEINLRAQGLT